LFPGHTYLWIKYIAHTHSLLIPFRPFLPSSSHSSSFVKWQFIFIFLHSPHPSSFTVITPTTQMAQNEYLVNKTEAHTVQFQIRYLTWIKIRILPSRVHSSPKSLQIFTSHHHIVLPCMCKQMPYWLLILSLALVAFTFSLLMMLQRFHCNFRQLLELSNQMHTTELTVVLLRRFPSLEISYLYLQSQNQMRRPIRISFPFYYRMDSFTCLVERYAHLWKWFILYIHPLLQYAAAVASHLYFSNLLHRIYLILYQLTYI